MSTDDQYDEVDGGAKGGRRGAAGNVKVSAVLWRDCITLLHGWLTWSFAALLTFAREHTAA